MSTADSAERARHGEKDTILEVPVFNVDSAWHAVQGGARRIELNRAGSYAAGGLTPTLAELEAVRAKLPPTIPVRVMVRPRGRPGSPPERSRRLSTAYSEYTVHDSGDDGDAESKEEEADEKAKFQVDYRGLPQDFVYSDAEFEEMERSIAAFKASGLLDAVRGDGFVFGLLRLPQWGAAPDRRHLGIARRRNKRLVSLASPYKCVFHRAFDDVVMDEKSAPSKGLQDVVDCGFDGILTSGGRDSATDSIHAVGDIIREAEGQIEIIIGGGIRSTNLGGFADMEGQGETKERRTMVVFHSSCIGSKNKAEEKVDVKEVESLVEEIARLREKRPDIFY